MVLLATAGLVYAADWCVLRARMARQSAYSTVQVDQYVSASLKGNKEDYYYAGTAQQECVRSIFPHASDVPCWWLKRHTAQWKIVGALCEDPAFTRFQLQQMNTIAFQSYTAATI